MTKYCPKCGAPNPDDALYCSRCGSPLPAAKPPEAAAAPSESKPAPGRRSRAWLWPVIGLVIVLLVAGGVPLMLNYNSLLSQYSSLQSRYPSLQSSYNSLQGQYQALNASYTNLQSRYSSLQSQYSSLLSQYFSLQSSYNSLQGQYSSLQSRYSSLQSSYNSLQSRYSSFQSGYNYLLSVANLQQTATWVSAQTVSEGAGSYYSWSFSTPYAGYVTVTVSSSTTSKTYVEISGASSNGITYDSGEISVGYGGTVSYPVLPGTVYVYVGNSNSVNGATETVTMNYTY